MQRSLSSLIESDVVALGSVVLGGVLLGAIGGEHALVHHHRLIERLQEDGVVIDHRLVQDIDGEEGSDHVDLKYLRELVDEMSGERRSARFDLDDKAEASPQSGGYLWIRQPPTTPFLAEQREKAPLSVSAYGERFALVVHCATP